MVSETSLLALVQVARIGLKAWEASQRGTLTQEELDLAWADVHDAVAIGQSNWEESKKSLAAKARREDQ